MTKKSAEKTETKPVAGDRGRKGMAYREMVATRLATLITRQFDRLDQALHQLAVESEEEVTEELYLRAKRELYRKRRDLQIEIERQFFYSFDKVLSREPLAAELEVSSTDMIRSLIQHQGAEIEQIQVRGEASANTEPAKIEQFPGGSDYYLKMAHALERGTWIEFMESDGFMYRARLAWVSPVNGKYMFIDQKGLKAPERTAQGLAAEFRRGSAKILKEVPLIDVAASNILYGLRKKMTNKR